MGSAMGSMDLSKLSQTMDSFEKSFENLDVASAYMEEAMGASSAMTTPESEVNELIMKVADEHHLELKGELESVTVGRKLPVQEEEKKEKEKDDDDLFARLNQLKAKPQ